MKLTIKKTRKRYRLYIGGKPLSSFKTKQAMVDYIEQQGLNEI